ncbi:MAG TPA: glycoside hydrolase family 3 C-terminal domain-containing protein [Mycobacteriales bacterium]|nr:glycoside hydrolase family 3 C-terminal domain-containing protein [Mycobacteriales bacterium]
MRRGAWAVAVLAVAMPLAVIPARTPPAHAAGSRPWLNSRASAVTRAHQLLRAMSVDQKLQLIAGQPLPAGSTGFVGYIPGVPSLGLPTLYLADGPVGVANGSTGVTALPSGISQAATFDRSLVERIGRIAGAEQRDKGHDIALGPDVDVLRIPYAGRAFESFGEDPYLSAQLGAAAIRGVQSQGVIAVAKHFVANTQETARHSLNAVISPRTESEIYEPPFKAAVKAGVAAVMCSYNRINGRYSCEDAGSLGKTLERAWRFRGFVVSDWGATHSTTRAASAGLDMQMPGGPPETTYFGTAMHRALATGAVPMSVVDEMAQRILWAMFSVGLFDGDRPDPAGAAATEVSTPEHRALATEAAEEGAVLLKNSHTLLPLSADSVHSIAVIGDAAGENAIYGGGGSSSVIPTRPVTPIAGITRRAAAAGVRVTTAQGYSNYRALEQLPPEPFTPSAGGGHGWTATYYPTNHFTGPPLGVENVTSLDVTTPPAAVAGARTWSVSYTATLTSPVDVTDEFALTAGHRATLYANGRQVARFDPRSGSPAIGLVGLKGGLPATVELDVVGGRTSSPVVDLTWTRSEGGRWAAAAAVAGSADVAVVFASSYSAEGRDLTSLGLPADEDRLIEAVARANPRTVVVLNTSSAVLMPWIDQVGAVLEMWYPGQQYGDAVAALLFGDASPSGHTPVTFPTSNHQGVAGPATVLNPRRNYPGHDGTVAYSEGLDVGYRYFDAHHERPLFPFGYGLAYTSFRLGPARISAQSPRGDRVRISVEVSNTGPRVGTTVVQLYLSDPPGAQEPPYQLKRFRRVTLASGEHRAVTFTVDRRDMSYFRTSSGRWTPAKGTYTATIGGNERDHATRVTWRYR